MSIDISQSIDLERMPQVLIDSIYSAQSWGFNVVIIASRILIIDGDYNFANDQEIDKPEHFIYAKDLTQFFTTHTHILSKCDGKSEFINILEEQSKRLYRFHKSIKYAQFTTS